MAGSPDSKAMRTVADVMSEPLLVDGSMTLQDASARMLEAGVEAAVVVDDGVVHGLLTAEAVAQALLEDHDPSRTRVHAVAEHPPPTTGPDEPLADVHQRMRGAERRLAVVVSATREPLGLLSDPEAAP
jgi:CIC family chloride channel protein